MRIWAASFLGRLLSAACLIVLWLSVLPALVAALALADLWGRIRRTQPRSDPEARLHEPGVSVVIPSYNGRDLLGECLPSLLHALKTQDLAWEVLVVDDGSSDGTGSWLEEAYPEVRTVLLSRNQGFGAACNEGARASRFTLLLLLNNDMTVAADFLAPLVGGFTDESVFAVAAQILFRDAGRLRQETGWTFGRIERGEFRVGHRPIPDPVPEYLPPALYAQGGAALVDSAKFLALGGFPAAYAPFYYEDVDLSYRAWRRGWRVLFAPESRVHHRHRATIGRLYSDREIQTARLKNEFLLTLRNVTDWRLLSRYLALRLLALLRCMLAGGTEPLPSVLAALSQLGDVLRQRSEASHARVCDRDVLEQTNHPAVYRRRWGISSKRDAGSRRVLILTPLFPFPQSHGGAVRLYNYVTQLARRGTEVFLLSLIEREEEREHLGQLERFCRVVRQIRRIPTRCPRGVRLFAFRNSYTEEMADAIRALHATHDFDVVHFEYTQMGVYLDTLRPPVPSVMAEIDVSFVTLWRRALQARGWERVVGLIRAGLVFDAELYLARRMTRVFPMSEHDGCLLKRFLPGLETTVVPNGVNTMDHRFVGSLSPRPTLLFVGYFRHPPNLEAVLYFADAVYPLIRTAVPEVEWLIAGAHPPPTVVALTERGPDIRVLGYVTDLDACYTGSAVFVAPIQRGSGTRMKILEAMSRGVPVVSTTLGVEGISATPGEDVLIGDTVEAFSSHVVRLLADRALAERLRRNARRLVERHYDYGHLVTALEEGYQLAMNSPSRQGPARVRQPDHSGSTGKAW